MVVGVTVRREKALDFSGCKDKEGPPAKPLLGAVAYHRNDGNDITPRSREYKMKLRRRAERQPSGCACENESRKFCNPIQYVASKPWKPLATYDPTIWL